MIRTKEDLKEYIRADFSRQNMKHPLLARLTFGEHDLTRRYLRVLRHLEYWENQKRSIFNLLPLIFYQLRYRRNCLKMGIYISPNTTGKGLLLPHPGFVRINSFARIGDNCTVLPMVLLGEKKPDLEFPFINIGDDCYIGAGTIILGPVNIGKNVTIGAGSVVTHDISDGSVVAGVPARQILSKK